VLRGSLEVIEFEVRRVIADAVPPAQPRESEQLLRRLGLESQTLTSCASALAALALHVLVIAPALWGDGPFRAPQDQKYRGDTALQWVVFEDSSGNSAIIGSTSPPPLTMRTISLTDPLPTPPTLSAQPSNWQSGGQSGLSAMSGRYMAQIRARVERAWLRPRTAIGDAIFQCQVQMDQDAAGRVLAITLVACNGATAWQLSLVHAIEAASPLPAPPNPAVFVHHVVITFRAMPYSAGASAALYEPPGEVTADDAPEERDAQSRHALQALGEAVRAPSAKSVTLRIEGSKVDVEPEHR
jgi:TonB C terminal